MKILITGGSGTISRYIVRELAKQGHEIILLNHHNTDCGGFSNVSVAICDRRDYPAFIAKCRELGPYDCVYDMISYTTEDAQSAVEAFHGITKQLVYCSTVDVYTKTGVHYPLTETSETNPSKAFMYAFLKQKSEKLLMDAHKRGDFNVTVLRPGHTYSESSPYSFLLFHAFTATPGANYHLDRINKGKPIIMHGDGMSVWSITHGSDTASAFVGACCNEKAYGKAYTVVGDECMSYRKYWETVAEEMGAPPIQFVCIPTDLLLRLEPEKALLCSENFMYNNIFDNSAAKRDLGLTCKITWREGSRLCLDAYKKNGGFVDSDKPEYAFYDRIIEDYRIMCNQLVSIATGIKNERR